ncbi:5'-3' exonuclease [Bacillus niameyensis]|uniref:5'-3' exonuclease n=1 Tax=Bacillus niameyensis TaxID=1522308 RepID=UPI0009FEC0DB|nr:5'-3' exonuclease H3TH domain-containing protein [Bacillus niameyensis]
MKQHLLLVDGMALLFRAFYATAIRKNFMVNSSGIPTNAVQGYLKHLLTAAGTIEPTHLAVCWDMGSVTFRNDLFSGYKANREAPPVEMIPQFDLAQQVTTELGIPNIGIKGYEADDCIGTICKQYSNPKFKVTVLTGDRDLLQIVDDHVDVLIMQKGIGNYKQYSKDEFKDEFEILPKEFIDVKALMGDPSDGYPGVKGIGEKTALKLIKEHHSIEEILDNLHKLAPSVKKKIENDLDFLHLSRKLAAIHCEVPLTFLLNDSVWKVELTEAMLVIDRYELKSVRNLLIQTVKLGEADTLSINA